MKYTTKSLLISIHSILLLFLTTTVNGQVSYSIPGSTFTEDFSAGLPTGADTPLWSDDDEDVLPGWSAYQTAGAGSTPTNYRITSSGSSSEAQLYQYRPSAGSSDGSFGTRPSGGTGDIILGVRFTNDTGISLNSITLGYTGEQWFESESTQNNQYIVAYQLGSPLNLTSGTWTTISSLDFNSPQDGGGDTNLDGKASANREVIAPVTVSIADWNDGSDLWVRWFDSNSSGFDQALAIDDVNFTAIPEPSTLLLVIMSFVAAYMFKKRKS